MVVGQGIAAAFCLLLSCAATACAQPHRNRVIKLIVPFSAAGVVDITGRLLAERGAVGANFVARAELDGYAILLSGVVTHAFAPSLPSRLTDQRSELEKWARLIGKAGIARSPV